MARLLQVFGFLSVLFRGATLTFQSLAIGGIVFLIFVVRRVNENSAALQQACLRWIRRAAIALAAMQISYVLANSIILRQSADMSLREVAGANFVHAGAIGIVSALTVIALTTATRSTSYTDLLLPAVAIITSSVMTSHSIARLDYRAPLVAFTFLHQAATAVWLGGLPYLLIVIRRAPAQRQILATRSGKRGSACFRGSAVEFCLRWLIQSGLRYFLRGDGRHQSAPLWPSFVPWCAQFSARPPRAGQLHSCQPEALRRSRNWHRHYRNLN